MNRKYKRRAEPERVLASGDGSSRLRQLGLLVVIAVVSALVISLAWLLLVSMFLGLVVVPDGIVYPADWPLLSATAQNNWLHAHAINLTGLAAVEHMFRHFALFREQFTAVGALTLSSAMLALVAFAAVKRRAS